MDDPRTREELAKLKSEVLAQYEQEMRSSLGKPKPQSPREEFTQAVEEVLGHEEGTLVSPTPNIIPVPRTNLDRVARVLDGTAHNATPIVVNLPEPAGEKISPAEYRRQSKLNKRLEKERRKQMRKKASARSSADSS